MPKKESTIKDIKQANQQENSKKNHLKNENIPDDKKIIEELQQQVEDWKDKALRALSEMENLRKRTQIDIEKNTKFALVHFAKDLLPVVDCLEGALACIPEQQNEIWKNIIIGIQMTHKQFLASLSSHGVKRMECLGQVFNPNYHKVIQEIDDEQKPTGTIVKELQAGYTIGDERVLREAMVIVTK